MNILLKILGVILLIAGFFLVYKPALIGTSSFPSEPYQRIEHRVKWGFLVGVGLFFVFQDQWNSLRPPFFALLSALTIGIMIARIMGVFLDGFYGRQMLWLGIELGFLILFFIEFLNNINFQCHTKEKLYRLNADGT